MAAIRMVDGDFGWHWEKRDLEKWRPDVSSHCERFTKAQVAELFAEKQGSSDAILQYKQHAKGVWRKKFVRAIETHAEENHGLRPILLWLTKT